METRPFLPTSDRPPGCQSATPTVSRRDAGLRPRTEGGERWSIVSGRSAGTARSASSGRRASPSGYAGNTAADVGLAEAVRRGGTSVRSGSKTAACAHVALSQRDSAAKRRVGRQGMLLFIPTYAEGVAQLSQLSVLKTELKSKVSVVSITSRHSNIIGRRLASPSSGSRNASSKW